jgi:hypothetical protein
VLEALNGEVLVDNECYFGGGTAIALSFGEYRESIDVDFEVSSTRGYRNLRSLVKGGSGLAALLRNPSNLVIAGEVRADQYGIRTFVSPDDGVPIKLEVINEGRIALETSNHQEICGVATLSKLDMVATKLLANSDRWADRSTLYRDLIDLSMIQPSKDLLRSAIEKSDRAYKGIITDLLKAIGAVRNDPTQLDSSIERMRMTMPRALLWKRILVLEKLAASEQSPPPPP